MTSVTQTIKIFAGSTGVEFAKKMCTCLNVELGDSETIEFSDKNLFVRINEPVRNKDVYLLQPIANDPNREFVELIFWIDAFKRASAKSVTAIIPYFSYAKGDKKDEPRVSIRARVCADAIEQAGADRVVTMDLHSPQVQGFFKKPVDHLMAMPTLCRYIRQMEIPDLVVVSPDAGFAKTAHSYARLLHAPVAVGDKTRTAHDEKAKIQQIIGTVEDKNCMIVDDFTISGGTLVDMSRTLYEHGAKNVYACVTHMMLTRSGVEAFQRSEIRSIISTDSVSNQYVGQSDKIRIVSVAPIFAETVRRIHYGESVSPLFDNLEM